MKGYIYLIENKINHKKYIGKTYRTIQLRWQEHLREISNSSNRPLYRAMSKYGFKNFEIQEIEYTENLEEREKFWIEFYDTFKNGYNATRGGDGTTYFPYSDQEVIEKFLELKTIIAVTIFFDCDFKTIQTRLINNKIDYGKVGNIYAENRSWQAKEVNQYSLEGEFIQSFATYSEAANWLVDNKFTTAQVKHIVTNISKVCRGLEGRKKSYGFIWKFPSENFK